METHFKIKFKTLFKVWSTISFVWK